MKWISKTDDVRARITDLLGLEPEAHKDQQYAQLIDHVLDMADARADAEILRQVRFLVEPAMRDSFERKRK